uniref:Chorein N-terminal domain-containing protein n=1 Tax=Schistocephalus solidus TaxID=70667 RepID=A0A0X3PLQ8_SCHSO
MQKIFSLDTYLGPFLMRYLGKYVKLRDDQFELSLWGGDAVLNHVELQYDIFEHLIPLPIGFKSGQVHELRIHIPWTRLGSSSIVITLNTVECILALKKPDESCPRNRGPPPSSTSSPSAIQDDLPPGYLQSYLNRILCNIQVVVNNLIVKFVEDTIVLSLNVRSLDCFPTSSNWIHGIPPLNANQNFCLYRLLKLTDLTLCMDKSDAKGHIAVYQDPIVYRCNLEVRIQTVYSQKSYCFNNGLASLCIANLLCSNLDCNISQTQLPLIARLFEIMLALAYGALDWSALSTVWEKRSSRESSNTPQDELERAAKMVSDSENSQQSWSNWAWSFVPSILQVGSSPSFDESSDEEFGSEFGDFTKIEGFKSNNSAEYLHLIYDSALENEAYPTEVAHTTDDGSSSSTTQPDGFSPSHIRENLQQKQRKLRRWRIRQLRAYQHKLPTLVLGGLVQKVTLNIKVDEPPKSPPPRTSATDMSSSSAFRSNTSRRRCAQFLAFQVEAENMGINCTQHGEEFSSIQIAVDSISAISCGDVCACGSSVKGDFSRITSHNFTLADDHKESVHCQNILHLSPIGQAGFKSSTADLFSCLFTDGPPGRLGLVRSVTTPEFPKVSREFSTCASNDAITRGLSSRQSPFPPMTRASYVETFGDEFFKCSRPALWMDVVTSRERPPPQPSSEWTEAVVTEANKYAFSRLLAGNLTGNFTLPTSHRIQQLLSLIATGSGKFKPCFDHSRLLVLPPQSPVDSWILQDRISQLNLFLPIQVSRVELSSFTLNVHPPTHNLSMLSDLTCIRFRAGPLLIFSCEPTDPVHMVSTMTHLQPSNGILDALAATLEDIADQPPLASEDFWGQRSQWVGCYGNSHVQLDAALTASKAAEVDDAIATTTISGITRLLQTRLLNACYTRRLCSLSELSLELLSPRDHCRTLIFASEVKLFQRNLFYPTSWPKQLACKLVTCECITQLSSEIRLQLSSSDLCQVVLLTSSLANEGHSIAAVLSHRSFWNNRHGCSQPTEVLLRRLFGPSPEEASPLPSGELLITAKGKCVLQNQQTPEESLFSLCLRTPEVSSVLLFSTTLLPIFERRSPWAVGLLHTKDKSGAVLRELPFLLLRYEAVRVSSGPSRAHSIICSFESVDILLSKALLNWIGRTQDSLINLLRVCETDESQPPVPPPSTTQDVRPPPPSSAALDLIIEPRSRLTVSGSSQGSFSIISSHQPMKSPSTEPGDRPSTSGPLFASATRLSALPLANFSEPTADLDFFANLSQRLAAGLSCFSACQIDIQMQSSSILLCPSEFPPTLHPSPSGSFPTHLLRTCLSRSPPPVSLLELTLPQLHLRGPSAGRPMSSAVTSPVKSPRNPSGFAFVFQEEGLSRPASPPTPPPVQSPPTFLPASFTWCLQAFRAGISVAGTRLAAGNFSVTMSVSRDDVKDSTGIVLIHPSPLTCNIFCNATSLISTGAQEDDEKLFYCVAARQEGDMSANHARNLLVTASLISSEFETIFSKFSITSTALRRTFPVQRSLRSVITEPLPSKLGFSSSTNSQRHSAISSTCVSECVNLLKSAPTSTAVIQPTHPAVPLSLLFQFTLPGASGRIGLQPVEAGNAVSWDLEGLSLTVNRTESMVLVLARLNRFAVLLQTKDRVFPLATPGELYLKTFMDITHCPGSRPRDNDDGATDGVGPTPPGSCLPVTHITTSASAAILAAGEQEVATQVPLSADERPGALTLAFLHTRVDQVRAAFQGKRFSDWLDRSSELFLLGRSPASPPPLVVEPDGSCDVGLPFINSLYAHIAPVDVVLCPDLVCACALFSSQVLEELHSPLKSSSSSSPLVETALPVATWPGHCMPLLFLILDKIRIFVPSSSIDCWTVRTATKGQEALVLTCDAVRLHPFPVNMISRPIVPTSHQQHQHRRCRGGTGEKHFHSIVSETEVASVGAGWGDLGTAHEDRQYVLRARGLGLSLVDMSQATLVGRGHSRGTAVDRGGLSSVTDFSPPLVGQCPALDWNRAAERAEKAKTSVWILPVLRPLSLTLSFAAPICESTLSLGKSRVVAGCGLEMNLDSDFVCTLQVPLIGHWLAGLTCLMAKQTIPTRSPHALSPPPRALLEATPTRLLLTGGLVRFVAWSADCVLVNAASSPVLCLLVADFIQPHLLWRGNTPWLDRTQAATLEFGLNNLQLHSRMVEHDWCSRRWGHSVRWQITQPSLSRVAPPFCPPRYLPLPLVMSPLQAVGQSQMPPLHEQAFLFTAAAASTAVDGGLLKIRLFRSYQPPAHVVPPSMRHPTNRTPTVASFKLDISMQRDLFISLTPISFSVLTSLIDSVANNMPVVPTHDAVTNQIMDIQKTPLLQRLSALLDSCSMKTARIKVSFLHAFSKHISTRSRFVTL